jgi:alpha-glucoside transport system substrate-binding protein
MERMTVRLMAGLLVTTALASAALADFKADAVAEAKKIAEGQTLTGYIEVIGQNSGAEGETLQQVYAAFTEATGVEVRYTGTQDITAIVQARVQAGNPPDVADIALGEAQEYAAAGKLANLTAAFGADLAANFNAALLDTASHDGGVFGIYQGMNPFMVWYNPKTYTGPKEPKDWAELVKWTEEQAAAGVPVWCAAQGAGAGSGFPGAQIIDNIFLKLHGPALYTQWGKGELSWESPEVKSAWEEFGRVVATDGHLEGGPIGALSTSISTGYNGLTADPATCQIALWGAWVPGLIGETAKPGETIDFFRVPASKPEFYTSELFQSAISVGFDSRPETLAFLHFIASTPAQSYLASLNRWPVANKNVTPETYPSVALQKIAQVYFNSGEAEFAAGPNLLNGAATGSEYYKGVVAYMQDPSSLDQVLATIEAATK